MASLYHGGNATDSVAIGVTVARAAVVAFGYSHPSNFTMILKTLESLEGHLRQHLREVDPTQIKAMIATIIILAVVKKMKWEEIKVAEWVGIVLHHPPSI